MKTQEKINEILQDANEQCENANYHDMVGLAPKLFKSIKDLCPKKNWVVLAEVLRDNIIP